MSDLKQRHRLTILHDDAPVVCEEDPALVHDNGLCDCGQQEKCNLGCIFGPEVEERKKHEPLKLLGRMELEPGEYIHNGHVWYCADHLSAS